MKLWFLCGHQGVRKSNLYTVRSSSSRRRVRDGSYKCQSSAEIKALCKQGKLTEAVSTLHVLGQQGSYLDPSIYKCLVQCCTSMKALAEGHAVHAHILTCPSTSIAPLESTLIYMYVQCGCIKDARRIFDHMTKQDVFVWNVMIAAYTRHGHAMEAFKLFDAMEQGSVRPDEITFVSILKTCKTLGNLEIGRWVHASMIKSTSKPYISIENSLLSMYAHYGSLDDAYVVFGHMERRDVVTWTLIITGYAMHGYAKEALNFFSRMKNEAMQPDKVLFLSILQACSILLDLEQGRQIHGNIILCGLDLEPFMVSTLVDLYSKCGSIEEARKIFDKTAVQDLVSWNAMLAGYAKHGPVEEAFKLYETLDQKALKRDKITFLNIINACSSLGNLEVCKQIHGHLVNDRLESDTQIMNSLLDMYAKCGSIKDARQVFDQFLERDVVSWTAMIAGYAKQGQDEEAFQLLQKMKEEGVNPDKFTFVSVLKACVDLAALEQGRAIHAHVIKSGLDIDAFMGSTLVDMYSKGGHLCDARHVFDNMSEHDVVSWTAMVVAHAQYGCGKEALQLMDRMLGSGVKLNHVTLVGVLSACSHSGLVEEGQYLFDIMRRKGAVTKTAEHYACMIDLLSRAGCLEEAENLLIELPVEPSVSMWLALLRSCGMCGNINLAKRVAKHVLRLEPENDAAFVLLSNVCAGGGSAE